MTDPISAKDEEMRKRSLAINLINDANNNGDSIVSTQIINEVCSVLRRKASFSEEQIQRIISTFNFRCTVVQLSVETLSDASNLRLRYGFSFWDSLIVASALSANAEILHSEDMQDGLVVEQRLAIVNPFK
jgi:predicted nucleic acid-binding protein